MNELRLSTGPQLLLDDLLVEDRFGLARVMQHPEKHADNPILLPDTPWEADAVQITSVLRDDQLGRYRMWYSSVSRKRYAEGGSKSYQALAYAESDDGCCWRKPLFDLCPEGEHQQTNLLHWGRGKVILNPNTSDPERRFLAVGLYFHDHPSGLRNDGINLLHSADGLHWEVDGDWHIFDHHSDTKNQLVYDHRQERWLLYCRPAIYASGRHGGRHQRRRMCAMISKDLRDWTYPEVVLYPDERDLPDYDHVQVFNYGSHLLMLYVAMAGDDTGRMHMRLASSADGIRWTRFHTYEDFIPHGEEGSYDAGIVSASSPPVRRGDDLLVYYNAMNLGQHEREESSVAWVGSGALSVMKPDRFVAQRAGDRDGWLLTRHFLLEGNTLRINMATTASGAVQVEVVKRPPRDGHTDYYVAQHEKKGYTHAYDCFGLDDCQPLTGDRIDQPVQWQGRDLSELVGQPVYLRFRLRNADLFSFTITNE